VLHIRFNECGYILSWLVAGDHAKDEYIWVSEELLLEFFTVADRDVSRPKGEVNTMVDHGRVYLDIFCGCLLAKDAIGNGSVKVPNCSYEYRWDRNAVNWLVAGKGEVLPGWMFTYPLEEVYVCEADYNVRLEVFFKLCEVLLPMAVFMAICFLITTCTDKAVWD
jgi:hypothetical protein